ncbi:hypothetical protein B0H13DRAFT_1874507 [Mycena leptocephala]|nr:hypothetical protein B0H13DRAFT_1874507 [Mycena leptocephala]
MYGLLHTQRRAKNSSPSSLSDRSLGGWVWWGFELEHNARAIPHRKTGKTLKPFKAFLSRDGWMVGLVGFLHWNMMYFLPHPTTHKKLKPLKSFLSLDGWMSLAGFLHWNSMYFLPHPTTRKTLKSFISFWSLDGWGDFGGVLHWNPMYVSFRTQRRVKGSSPSCLFGRSLARWVWQGFALELDLSTLPHPTTRKTLKSLMSFWSLDGWGDFGGVLHWNLMSVSFRTQRRVKGSSPSCLFGRSLARWVWQGFALELDLSTLPHPTTRKTLKSLMSFWSLDGWGDFGGVLHWNLMSGSFRTQRDAKLSSSSPFCYCLPGGSVWRGFSTGTQCLFNYELQKPIARVLPHPTTHKRVKFFMSVWSLDGSTTTKMGRTKNKSTQEQTGSTAAERKKQAWTTYYEQKMNINSADTIREKRRLQMAEKRALLKAKQRASDKPRPKKEPKKRHWTEATARILAYPMAMWEARRSTLRMTTRMRGSSLMRSERPPKPGWDVANWASRRPELLSRNSIAPESPFHNWRNAEAIEEAFGEEVGSDDDVGSDDEHEPGVRSISEVAHEAANHWEVDIDQDSERRM